MTILLTIFFQTCKHGLRVRILQEANKMNRAFFFFFFFLIILTSLFDVKGDRYKALIMIIIN